MVAICECDEAIALGFLSLLTVLDRHFQGALDGGGPIIREEDALERVGREKLAKPLCELASEWMGEAEERGVRDFLQLLMNGRVDRWVGVAMDIRPDG